MTTNNTTTETVVEGTRNAIARAYSGVEAILGLKKKEHAGEDVSQTIQFGLGILLAQLTMIAGFNDIEADHLGNMAETLYISEMAADTAQAA